MRIHLTQTGSSNWILLAYGFCSNLHEREHRAPSSSGKGILSQNVAVTLMSVWLLALISIGCTEEIKPDKDPLPYDVLPSNTLYGTEIRFMDSLMLKAVVRAGRVQWYSSQQLTQLDSGVYVEFYWHVEPSQHGYGVIVHRLKMLRATCGLMVACVLNPIVQGLD